MRTTMMLRFCMVVLAALMVLPADAAIRKRKVKERRGPASMLLVVPSPEIPMSRKMSTSAFPVQITVSGRVVQIQSDRSQLLPIYNGNGVLYMTTRLNKGKNWLGGLPRGRYFINNRPITIN